ncbi:hypothetical protein BJX64DRAFT_290652 [Aspergillus heterothallicus]
MDILNATAHQLTDQARRFLPIAGITGSDPQDRFFLVMRKTGSGKSTFVARCTGNDVSVGHGLYSCTNTIDSYSYTIPPDTRKGHVRPRRIHLIDTPGFNDTNRPDIETLKTLAAYLGASYGNGVRIHGIIMLHPIADNRMGGSSVRNIEKMKAMCGFASYESVAVLATMWTRKYHGAQDDGRVSPLLDDRLMFEQREAELLTEQRFWGELVSGGATVFRHACNSSAQQYQQQQQQQQQQQRDTINEETRSSRRIVSHLIAQSDRSVYTERKGLVLRLQWEIIDEGKTLGETAAGIAVAGDLYVALKEHKDQLRDLQRELDNRLASRDATHAVELQHLKTELEIKMAAAEDERRALRKSMQDLHDEEEQAWKEKIQRLDQDFRAQIKEREEELEDLEASIRDIRGGNARRELDDAKRAHALLQSRTGNITNGLANGVAAGVATAVVSGGNRISTYEPQEMY